ncbi:hypothetical protein HIM_04769 [Hirsutella minnesotensis 3608]|uniref:Pal1 cell morphology protein n=1 Tax=Hirsutella minnesotensis 3608 TaxID=1043627 RepID=A0A0F7ZPR2_9HYPO|nr:hypothetical protein HIM_04769 [Hirsutella minnesotensis 3608]
MSFSDPPQPGQQQAGLSVSLSSNNPFRNRAASPSSIDAALSSPASPFDPPPRPLSRNPFFDNPVSLSAPSTANMPAHSNSKSLSAEEIFDSLTLDDKKEAAKPQAMPPPQRRPADPPVPRRENKPAGKLPRASHRPTRSQEEALRARKPPPGPPRPGPSGSPQRKPPPRPRRNSESSVLDLNAAPITAEEMKMIEAKRLRERQKREREGRSSGREGRDTREGREGRESKERSKSTKRPSRRLDIIDQLDATSIYGTGLFHHDGPFDALNPHRNRQNSRRAPMQAFPKDSLNNSLGGAGPLNRNPDHAVFMGNGTDEAFRDYAGNKNCKNGYSYPPNAEAAIFDPVSRGAAIHGDESVGLGTSTFLEGTPAARTAIARREAEQAQELVEGGLQRKKSLAQRIRHINKGPREYSSSGRMINPDGAYSRLSQGPVSAGAVNSASEAANPFFSEFGKGEETLSVKPRDGNSSPTSPPRIPRRLSGGALERRSTADGFMTSEESNSNSKPSGLLGRMKSLKGGRKPRISDQGPAQGSGLAM